MRAGYRGRGIALVSVLLATIVLLALIGVLVELAALQLQRSTAQLRSLEALAGADAGAGWVRGLLAKQKGDVAATVAKLGSVHGERRFIIDDRTYVLTSVSLTQAVSLPSGGDHVDLNLEEYPQAAEQPLQVQASTTVFSDGVPVSHRASTTLLRVFPAWPYSDVVGYIDDAGPVGIDSPGDAAGQTAAPNASELLINAFTVDASGDKQPASRFAPEHWKDNNSQGPGPLP